MNPSEHLTRNQIAAFGAGSLATSDSRVVGGHLVRCVECRSLLPTPDPARVWTAITEEHDFNTSQPSAGSETPELSYSQTLAAFFGQRSRLAWTGGMLAVIVSLAALFIFTLSNQQEVDTEVARFFELENPISPPTGKNGSDDTDAGVSIASKPGAEVASSSTDRESARNLRNTNATIGAKDNRTTTGVKRSIAATRGATIPCTIGKTILMELGSAQTDLILRWKPVPKATRYHLYVSDDNEILVDEFETHKETSYTLKKPLDPLKAYKWKIVITLENGQKLYADAQKFTAKDFHSSFSGYKSKARSDTRCLANE